MFRYSLRTFLIITTAAGILLAAVLQWRWQPSINWPKWHGATANGTKYELRAMVEVRAFGGQRWLNGVIIPERTDWGLAASATPQEPKGAGLKVYPNGVFINEQLIGGYGTARVLIVLAQNDVRVIELSPDDIQELDSMSNLEDSSVWQEKVEPEIERLVGLRRNSHDQAYRAGRGLPP